MSCFVGGCFVRLYCALSSGSVQTLLTSVTRYIVS